MNLDHSKIKANSLTLDQELAWFEEFLQYRTEQFKGMLSYHDKHNNFVSLELIKQFSPPDLSSHTSVYAQLVQRLQEAGKDYYKGDELSYLHFAERIILVLTLVPHIRPEILDIFFFPNQQNREFTEFGGIKGKTHQGFLPTGETAMFILAGSNLQLRLTFQSIFDTTHFFAQANVLTLISPANNDPMLSGTLEISREYLQSLTTGKPYQPDYSPDFPAKRITTLLNWQDLVLDYYTTRDVDEVRAWLRHRHIIQTDTDFNRELIGYRCLFYGPSGTGKTLTSTLLGKDMNMEVYRIDLSKVVSKYIGETEKNLSNVFDQAAHHDWLLFFDEGDALFGKRTENKSSNDRHANQEVAFLLQKIEEHPGVIILATNVRSNMDKAFLRRFQSEVYFPIPDEQSRFLLWERAFTGKYELEEAIDMQDIARKYEITGAAIKNIKHYCSIMALDRKSSIITEEDFREGLRKQLEREGKKL
jgi:hypothetical protein